jgi:hypothetical protein
MRLATRGFFAGAALFSALSLVGCGEDNEKNPAAPTAGPVKTDASAPVSDADYAKQQQTNQYQKNMGKMGYPGTGGK